MPSYNHKYKVLKGGELLTYHKNKNYCYLCLLPLFILAWSEADCCQLVFFFCEKGNLKINHTISPNMSTLILLICHAQPDNSIIVVLSVECMIDKLLCPSIMYSHQMSPMSSTIPLSYVKSVGSRCYKVVATIAVHFKMGRTRGTGRAVGMWVLWYWKETKTE